MLEKMNLSKSIKKSDYRILIYQLERKLGLLHRRAMELKIPIIIVFEGWTTSGKGRLINKLLQVLDPKSVNSIPSILREEKCVFDPFFGGSGKKFQDWMFFYFRSILVRTSSC